MTFDWLRRFLEACEPKPPVGPPPGQIDLTCDCVYVAQYDCDAPNLVSAFNPLGATGKTISWKYAGIINPPHGYVYNRWIKHPQGAPPSASNNWICQMAYVKKVTRRVPQFNGMGMPTSCADFPTPRGPVTLELKGLSSPFLDDWPTVLRKDGTKIIEEPWPPSVPEPGLGGQARREGCVCPKKYIFTPCVDCEGDHYYKQRTRQRKDRVIYVETVIDILGLETWMIAQYKDRSSWTCFVIRYATPAEAANPNTLWNNFRPHHFKKPNTPGQQYYTQSVERATADCTWAGCSQCMNGFVFRLWGCHGQGVSPTYNFDTPQLRGLTTCRNLKPESIKWLVDQGLLRYYQITADAATYKWWGEHARQNNCQNWNTPIIYKTHQQRALGDAILPAHSIGKCWNIEAVGCPTDYELKVSQVSNFKSLNRPAVAGQPNTEPGEINGAYKQDYANCAACTFVDPVQPPEPKPPVPPPQVKICGYPPNITDDMCSNSGELSGTGHRGGKYYGVGSTAHRALVKRNIKTGGMESPYKVFDRDRIILYIRVQMPRHNLKKDCSGTTSRCLWWQWQWRSNVSKKWLKGRIYRSTTGAFTPLPVSILVKLDKRVRAEPIGRRWNQQPLGDIFDGKYKLLCWSPRDGQPSHLTQPQTAAYNSTKHWGHGIGRGKTKSCEFEIVIEGAKASRRKRYSLGTKIAIVYFTKNRYYGNEKPYSTWCLLSDIPDNEHWCYQGSFPFYISDRELMPEAMAKDKWWVCGSHLRPAKCMAAVGTPVYSGMRWNKHCWKASWIHGGKTYGNSILNTPLNLLDPWPPSFFARVGSTSPVRHWTTCLKCNTYDGPSCKCV